MFLMLKYDTDTNKQQQVLSLIDFSSFITGVFYIAARNLKPNFYS